MAILAGIDEAGFGPLLGPLLVSCSALAVKPELLEADLWRTLARSVGKTRQRLGGRLLIADSKKAYHRAQGLGPLERTVLAALHGLGQEPASLTELLTVLCPDCLPRLREYPWHQKMEHYSLAGRPADMKIAARVFADDQQAQGARLIHLQSGCLDVAYFNTLVGRMKNKSQVLFFAVTQLIQGLLDAFPDDVIHVQVDRQGGRAHYREPLLRSFAGMDLRIVQEGEEVSTYELRAGGRRLRLSFEVGADDRYLPVSLASMVSKYLRELLMGCQNEYFVGLSPDLKPTAGYWQDGQRFVADLGRHLPSLEIDRHRLIRCC